ncbi:MAG: hypothetical protein IJ284_01895 [Clostridia bacterium]|nr:hypothetical protein [Clostridia bacterium]
MNGKKRPKTTIGKDCAYVAVFVALTIAAQLCLSVIPGVEVVTVLFVAFSYAFGIKRGMVAATAFSLLRQFVFGFFPTVLVLYLVYYNALSALFGLLGKRVQNEPKNLLFLTAVACVCTMCFTMLDNILTPLWYGYTARAAKLYFYASFAFMIPQVICTAISVGMLFIPLTKVFQKI